MIVLRSLILIAVGSLVACATTTDFQAQKESLQDTGYKIENTDQRDTFYVHSNFKTGTKSKFIIAYVGRVVGETCLARGFAYFEKRLRDNPRNRIRC